MEQIVKEVADLRQQVKELRIELDQLKTIFPVRSKLTRAKQIRAINQLVRQYFGADIKITEKESKCKRVSGENSKRRHIWAAMLVDFIGCGPSEVADIIGYKSHTSSIYSYKRCKQLLGSPTWQKAINELYGLAEGSGLESSTGWGVGS